MTGRPTKFTLSLADIICERIADGESLRSICRDEAMPDKATVFRWLASDDDFATKYVRAREAQADALVDEMIDIADDGANDWMEKHNAAGETTGWQENGEALRRSQLRISTRQWIAEKLKPKKYGAKVELEHGVTGEVSQLLEAINGKTRGLPNGG
ncbi:terminase small subunit protein [Rhizobium sophoriradicis]|uniref:terminase small subunit-like protein n=1 Tax=Rhizobium sophoriradicis TaxID=1535245 RepID=UPI000BBD9CCC|nr:terminase small subunit protein [Rhizobium sophoriradicis]PCK86353.1 terminase small subunit protein [Rhizobium sophoriradicis]